MFKSLLSNLLIDLLRGWEEMVPKAVSIASRHKIKCCQMALMSFHLLSKQSFQEACSESPCFLYLELMTCQTVIQRIMLIRPEGLFTWASKLKAAYVVLLRCLKLDFGVASDTLEGQ